MKKNVKIHIGEIYASSEPTVIETILGSCVSVCLYDPVIKTGGMNHILLPGKADLEKFDDTTRYGINAMEVLINSMMRLGSRRNNIFSKIFGGAHIIKSIDRHMSPGPRNVRFVEEFLELEEIPIISRNTGGNNGRKILFHTHTGDVFLKTLANPSFEAVAREEGQYTRLVKSLLDTPADVELFNNKG
ncbi:MAG: chemotaxis protein CheD [bacterium]|nr:chemotaxis protein CheD [bacterium]